MTDLINKKIQELEHKYYGANDVKVKDILVDIRKALSEVSQEAAENICKIIDDIEMTEENHTLEEWKRFKAIRNAIRDKYVLETK